MKLVESLSWFNPQATHHIFSLGLLGHSKLSRPKPIKHPRCAWGNLEPTGPSWKAPSRILEMKIQRCRKKFNFLPFFGLEVEFYTCLHLTLGLLYCNQRICYMNITPSKRAHSGGTWFCSFTNMAHSQPIHPVNPDPKHLITSPIWLFS